MTASTNSVVPKHTRGKLLATTIVAFLLGLFVVVGVILPAEFSYDPLGTGRHLGVLGLAEEGSGAVVLQDAPHRTDRVSFQLAPFESVEYSYRMNVDDVLVYSWQASAELVFNLHSTPDLPFIGAAPTAGTTDLAESFSSGRVLSEQGTYTATFTGQHGWFWENRTNETVTLELATSGFMGASLRSAVGLQESGLPRSAL